jgi:hypothetical protein
VGGEGGNDRITWRLSCNLSLSISPLHPPCMMILAGPARGWKGEHTSCDTLPLFVL